MLEQSNITLTSISDKQKYYHQIYKNKSICNKSRYYIDAIVKYIQDILYKFNVIEKFSTNKNIRYSKERAGAYFRE